MSDGADAMAGCLLGQALGDALGFVVEARPFQEAGRYVTEFLHAGRAGELSHPDFPFGQYSDDTQLARELLLSVAESGGWDAAAFARRVADLFSEGRDVGSGPGTRGAAMRLAAGIHWSRSGTPAPYAGNGSAMRAAPLGVLFRRDGAALERAALEQSSVTHLDPRCGAGSLAVATAASLAMQGRLESGRFLETIADRVAAADASVAAAVGGLARWVHLPPGDAARRLHTEGLDPEFADEWRGISASVIPSLVWSLYAFLHAPDDYWTAVCTAIAAGGDTDTMAAITGAIAGARVGEGALPAPLLRRLTDRGDWGAEALRELARDAARVADG